MSKAVRLKNDNYLDSTSIVHGKRKLSTILNKLLNRSLLVKAIEVTEQSSNIEINGLDIVADGGIYEIFGNLQSVNTNGFGVAMLINGSLGNSVRNETVVEHDSTTKMFHYVGTNENFGIYLGRASYVSEGYFHITLYRRSENRIYYELKAGLFTENNHRQFIENGLVKTEQNNITSIKLVGIESDNDAFKNCEIKIYKK